MSRYAGPPPGGGFSGPPPTVPQSRRRRRDKGWWGSLSKQQQKAATNIGIYAGILFFVVVPGMLLGLWMVGVFGGEEEDEVSSEVREAVELPPTPVVQQPTVITRTIVEQPTLTTAEISATAIAHQLYNRPAQPAADFIAGNKLLVGSFNTNPDFGGCDHSSVGFTDLYGNSFFLYFTDLEMLPEGDLLNQQAQLIATDTAIDGCSYPLLLVSSVRYPAEATPAPQQLHINKGEIVQLDNGEFVTATPHYQQIPSVAPTTNNPHLANVPYNGPDGQPLPTVTNTPATGGNFYGQIALIGDCEQTNFALDTGERLLLIIFDGAQPPPIADPASNAAILTGKLDSICNRAAIRATSAQYLAPTSTPSPSLIQAAANVAAGSSGSRPNTATPTPANITVQGEFRDDAQGCYFTNFGLQGDNGEFYYLSISGYANLENMTQRATVLGKLHRDVDDCDDDYIAVSQIYFDPTPTPTTTPTTTPTFTPSPTATATATFDIGYFEEEDLGLDVLNQDTAAR